MQKIPWKDAVKSKEFLNNFALKFGITNPQDWGQVKIQDLLDFGGNGLMKYHCGSILRALQYTFPGKEIYQTYKMQEQDWKKQWFSKSKFSYWQETENQKLFLQYFAKEHNIQHPSDWGRVTKREFEKYGGTSLIAHYGNSLARALKSIFCEIEWKDEWFINRTGYPIGYWRKIENQKALILQIAKELNVKKPRDWGNISASLFIEHGGGCVLKTFYQRSIYQMLSSTFKEVHWDKRWFKERKGKKFWQNVDNGKIFFDKIAREYNLQTKTDWNRITKSLIMKNGGIGFLRQHQFSIQRALSSVYPLFLSNEPHSSNEQATLQSQLNVLIP